jgi:hypothetical protein
MRRLLAKEPSLEAVVNRIIGEDAIKRIYFQYWLKVFLAIY